MQKVHSYFLTQKFKEFLIVQLLRSMNMAKISVDKEKCIGCGACAATCPATFEMFEGKARVKKADVKKLTCEEEACENCPVAAIIIKK